MPVNPATKPEHLNSPVERANDVNDASFENSQGYFPYDLTHQEVLTPLFGKITPSMHMITSPADRHVIMNNQKTILNRIPGNFMSTVNQYTDTVYVPFRSVFPINYEKLIPNPSKGSDLPNSALPMFNLGVFVQSYLNSSASVTAYTSYGEESVIFDPYSAVGSSMSYSIGRLITLSYMFSRGQLLDYLGFNLDLGTNIDGSSIFQSHIDSFLTILFSERGAPSYKLIAGEWDLTTGELVVNPYSGVDVYDITEKSSYRAALDTILENGKFPWLTYFETHSEDQMVPSSELFQSMDDLITDFRRLFLFTQFTTLKPYAQYIADLNSNPDPFNFGSWLNMGVILAYQQAIAQYFTNDSIDNIFNSDLYMQNLRSILFPADDSGFSREPVFSYNGVSTEYDYISTGSLYSSIVGDSADVFARQHVFVSTFFMLRNSLRFGDMFATARPDMLAVGDITIPVDGGVSPIDVTQNLLRQRYLNAVNYIGSGFIPYYNSIYGVIPSDTGCFPRFVMHKKVELDNQITNNTADKQGEQTTNLVAWDNGKESAIDVFIDDFGFLIQFISYDVLPVYTSGIDPTFHLADRFDFFNPMLQNIGDQPIRLSALNGNPNSYISTFGYTMRNSEYKYKISKAHGAFANNELKGYLFRYPMFKFAQREGYSTQLKISPDFIRDKPFFLDSVIPEITGVSPASYFHFVVSCTNVVHSARKISKQPPILF